MRARNLGCFAACSNVPKVGSKGVQATKLAASMPRTLELTMRSGIADHQWEAVAVSMHTLDRRCMRMWAALMADTVTVADLQEGASGAHQGAEVAAETPARLHRAFAQPFGAGGEPWHRPEMHLCEAALLHGSPCKGR